MFSQVIVISVSAVASILLALFVFARNYKARVNQAFLALSVLVVSWMMSSMMTDNAWSFNSKLFFGKMSFAIGILIPYGVLTLGRFFPRTKKLTRIDIALGVALTGLSVLSFTNLIVADIELTSTGVTNIVAGSLNSVWIIAFLLGMARAIYVFFLQYRKANKLGKNQVKIMLFGLGAGLLWGVMTNAVIPLFAPYLQATRFGFFATFIFVGITGYAILRHKLFDLRLVVARSLGYVLSVVSFAFAYGLLASALINLVFSNFNGSKSFQQAVYTLLAILLAFTFQPLKRFFDKWTNRLFYRDAYDSQELLDRLNRTLVSTLDLEKLLKDSGKIIMDSIKAESIIFGINESEKTPHRIIGVTAKSFNEADFSDIELLAGSYKDKTIVADELVDDRAHLRNVMAQNETAVLVKLRETSGRKIKSVGLMILGNKKSGGPFTGQDVRMLEIIADELVIAVQNALRFGQIEEFNITLQEKVDDATKKLRDANKRLIELDQTKDDFISMASHQLRTPLTSIKGYVSMVMEGDAGKITKKQNELLNQSFISAQRMVYLIADLLNVSRLRTGKFVIDPEKTNLADVIDGEMAQLTETAKGRKIELKYNKPSSFPELMLDENKTRQVIMNFIDNAIYYTPTDGHVNVNLEDKGETIEFTVVDDGIGVPKSVQHNLFNKFFRADNAKKARPDGTGLGLFMAKKVVVAQGGSIIFRSDEGKGSTFGFSFNKKPLLPENFKGVVADKK